MKNLRNKKFAFTHLVKALRSNRSSAKLTQSPSRFSLGFAPCSESFAVEPSVQSCSISSLSGIHFRSFRPQIRSLTGLRFARPSAFTLAEVLITLTVLGVIAAITIPGIVRNFQDRATVTRVKKIYSTLDNAINLALINNGSEKLSALNGWPMTSQGNPVFLYNTLKPYLNVSKECNNALHSYVAPKCWYSVKYLNKSGNYSFKNEDYRVVLKDNTVLTFIMYGSLPPSTAPFVSYLLVDVNGFKGPNRFGYDVFEFTIGEKGLYLYENNFSSKYSDGSGLYANIGLVPGKADYCKPNSSGTSCATWILRHNNMDYKYRDVSAEW